MDTPTRIVTVLTPDRPGIVHALVARPAEADVSHLAIGQTVVHGAFTIALVLAVPESADPEALTGARATLAAAAEAGCLSSEKLEAMTSVCSVGLDMLPVPGDVSATTLAGLVADEMAIGMVNAKTTATRIVPVPGKRAGEHVSLDGRIPAPLQAPKN